MDEAKPSTRPRRRLRYQRKQSNPWMIIGWCVVGAILLAAMLFVLTFCTAALVITGSG